MDDYNSNNGENDNQILSAADLISAAQKLLTPALKETKFAHRDVLNEILEKTQPVDFCELSGVEDQDKVPQKHQIVICIEQFLKTTRDNDFNLAKKDDFIFAYNGEFWKEIPRERVKHVLSKAAEKLGVHRLEARHYEFTEKLYKQFLKDAYFEPFEPKSEEVLINLLNGTFEFDGNTQNLREFRAADFLPYQLPFSYDETADCPIFRTYINQVLPELELQNIVAEFFAYPFIKHLKLEKAALFHGSGANGKSVLFDVIRALYGRENIANFSLSNLMEEHNRALIANKLLNYGSEINASTTKDVFKNLVSTEPIQARLKYGNSFLMENYAKLCFNCNELPRDFERSHAYFRRLLVVPFRATIPENKQDKELAQKIIKTELPGVFNWILEGLRRLLENKKFTESMIVQEEVELYRIESDSIAMFLDDHNFVPEVANTHLLKDIYSDYQRFCQTDGYRPYNKRNFVDRLRKDFNYKTEKNRNGIQVFCNYLKVNVNFVNVVNR